MNPKVEKAHTLIAEQLAIFATAAPTGVGGALQLRWHRFGLQPPAFEASCGASIQDDPPVRMNKIHRVCPECKVGPEDVKKANDIIRAVQFNRL